MSYNEHLTKDRRLRILQLLCSDNDYSLNKQVLLITLADFAHSVSMDKLNTDLSWLAEQALLSIRTINNAVKIATLTQRGVDVAMGKATQPGIRRPTVLEINELKELTNA